MKTFTKHILLLALMLFGVAGAAWAQTVFTTLQEGDVIHVGDQFNPSQLCLIQQNSDYIVACQPGSYGNVPLTLVRANITDYVVTESATGAYFLFRASNGSYHFTDEGKRIAATENSDGLVVTELGTNSGYPLVTLAVHFPDPYAPALDETTGHWNFLMPGSNKVVKAVLYDSIVLGPNVELYDADPAFAAGDIYTRGDSTIYYYDTNNHHSFYLRADEQADGKYFGFWSDLDPTDAYYTDRTYRRVSTGSFTCGQRFTAAYLNNYTLTLVTPQGGGTLSLDGEIPGETTYNISIGGGDTYTNVTFPFQTMVFLQEGLDEVYNDGLSPLSIDQQVGNYVVITISEPYDGGRTIQYSCGGGEGGAKTIFCTAVQGAPIMPYGISKTGDNTYSVMEGLKVDVTATPDAAHYLARIDGHDTVSNYACGYSFVMPSNDKDLLAVFNDKPTLTLTQTDGGTLEAIVPQGEPVLLTTVIPTATDIIPGPWTNDTVTVTLEGDLKWGEGGWIVEYGNGNQGYVSVTAAAGFDIAYYKFYFSNGNPYIVSEETAAVYPYCKGSLQRVYTQPNGQGQQIGSGAVTRIEVYTPGTANVIASSTPNTYIIDYGTPVTVVATPDAQHYLVSFSDDDPATERNSNIAVEKTYDSVVAPFTSTATFQAKPTLTLTANDGGTMSVLPGDGIIDASARIYTLTFTGFNNGNMNTSVQVNASEFPVTLTHINGNEIGGDNLWNDFAWVNSADASNDDGKINCSVYNDYHNFRITISGAFDGTANIHVDGANGDWGGEARDISVSCVLTTNDIAYIVDYGTEVTVEATPDSIHYLATLGGVTMGSNTAKDTTFALTATTNLAANFAPKPTLTLAHNQGGEMEVVPEEVMAVNEFTIPSSWNNDNTLAAATDLPSDFQSVSEAEARAWQNTTGHPVYLFYRAYSSGTVSYVRFNANGTVADVSTGLKSVIYNNVSDVYEGYLVRYTTVGAAANVIASTAEPNTYYIDYNTSVTVKATPSDTAYLVRFDQDADTNSNTAVEKTYGPLTAALTTAEATFNAKPTLALTSNEGGEMSLPGYTPGSFTVSTFEFPVDWSDLSMSYFIMAEDLPADFTPVTEAEMRNWNPGIEGNYIVFFRPHTNDRALIAKYENGVNTSYSLTARKKTAASTYEGYQIYYVNSSTPAVFPEGVVAANNTLDTFVVNYGANVTVVATPSDTAYMVRFDQDADTNSNTAVEKLYENITEDTTSRAYFNDKPVLTLAANDTSWGKVMLEGAGSAGGAGGEVTIGDGTSTSYYTPFNSLWGYSFVESLYTAEEIGTAGTITSISYNLQENSDPQTNNFVIYMKNVSRSTFANEADYEHVTDADIVYSGSVTFNPGWSTITLDTPFEYDGTSNLMIALDENSDGYSTRYFYYTSNAGKVVSYHSDSYNPDPYNLGSYEGNKYVKAERANIKLDITPAAGSGLPEGVVQLDSVTYRVDYGTEVTVIADATELHHVKNWVDADSVAYPADSITYSDYFVTTPEPLFPAYSTLRLKVTADTVTKAIFGINSYDVFARVNTTEDVRGTVRAEYIDIDGVSQSVAADDTVTYTAQGGSLSLVIATPTEPGYHFERWTDTLGTELGTNDTLEVTEAAAVIAVFDTNVYQISGTVAEGSEEWGEVTGSGDYRHFTQATLEALPIEHYHFVKWEDGNTENPRVIDVVGPESHQAEFAIDRFIVSWSSNDEAMGHVVGPYDNHTTGAPIPRLRGAWGTTFQLVAQPAEHHMLDYWSSGQTTDTIQHTITENAELVAYFKHVPYIVTVLSEDETMGTVAGTDTLEWQESTEISATANYGYHFTMWNDSVTDNPRTVVNNIESDQTFTASFAKNEYTVTVVSADETMGSVAGTDTVEYLDEIEISATANEHYHFVQWNDGETANPRTVSVTKNETYTATFAPNVYTLTLGSNNAIMGTVALTAPAVTPNADGSYSIAYGTAVTVKGSASSRCFELGSWSDGAVVTADGSHSFSMAGNLVLTATFVNHLFRSDTVADVCDRFVWHGIAYTETPDVAPLHRLTTVDGCDSALVLNLTVRHSSTGVDEQVHCMPYTWIDGVTYSESNHTAQYTLPGANAEQCDSIVTLDLTIGTQAESTEVVNACDSYEWHGVVYTETPAEAPTYTYHTLEGCDSTVTLQLTIGHPTEGIETIVACAPIEWHGTVYSESTDEPTWHTTNAAGCDSTVTLHLTIAPAIETEETVEACDEYEWHGVVYTETPAEAPTYTTVSVQGCDSTVTLHLTVNHSTAAVETVVACNSYEWHGVSYASSTTVPTYTTTGSNGCDSTTTLHLTINRSTSAVETVEACDSYEWHGTTYTTSTSLPTYTTEGSNGCDSTTTLNLTIKQSSRATETVVTCDEYEWHGVLFTETPVEAPTYTTEGSNGCDSTVTLNLTVNHSADVVETIGACAAIEWHGTVYSESTTEPTWHSTTVAGCDSTVTLHLTISDRIETEETVVACDSYEWHGVVYTASTDNATWSTTSIQGCDSTVTLHLTINRSTTGSETIEACESYEWHGVTYRQSGSYTFDTLNVAGCDSTVTLTLTLHQPTSGSEFVTTCGSYVWHEVTYTQSGAYVWHGTDVHGCDSTVTLLLTILQPVYSTENRTACNSYTWHGTEYSESGDYTWSTTAVSGCDSIVTLHLTINLPVTSDVEESACERYTWNGIVYSTSGDYVQTFTGVNGCDSTVTLHLTVNMPATETLGVTACDSYEWHEVTYTESGVYSWHGTTVAGCDSTATLNLTIGHSADTTISLQGEGSIVWNGETFTQSGTYERVIRTVLGCDSTVTLNLVILPEGFVMPYLYNIMDVVLTINHFQQGETNLQYHWYRWYRNGKMVAEGRAMDTYSEGGSKLNGVYYLEVAIDESLEYWVRSNEVTIGTVGIDEAEDIDFTVAPNPVMHGSTVSVAVEGADVQGAVISVYDVQGREVLRQQNSAFIEAPAASGMYMVRLTLNDGRTAVKRLIVK